MSLIRVGLVIGACAGVAMLWYLEREAYADGKVRALTQAIDEKTKEVTALRNKAAEDKAAAVNAAREEFAAAVAALEVDRAKQKALADDRANQLVRLRATSRSNPIEIREAAGGACRDQELQARQLAKLLVDGQQLALEGAGLLLEAGILVDAGFQFAKYQDALIRLAQRYAEAVEKVYPEL